MEIFVISKRLRAEISLRSHNLAAGTSSTAHWRSGSTALKTYPPPQGPGQWLLRRTSSSGSRALWHACTRSSKQTGRAPTSISNPSTFSRSALSFLSSLARIGSTKKRSQSSRSGASRRTTSPRCRSSSSSPASCSTPRFSTSRRPRGGGCARGSCTSRSWTSPWPCPRACSRGPHPSWTRLRPRRPSQTSRAACCSSRAYSSTT